MDLFSTNALIGVVQDLKAMVKTDILDRYFPIASYEATEEIHFDVIDNKRRLAPFVSPLREGRVVASNGYTTKTFKPAYVKPKEVWQPQLALKRPAGAPLASALDPEMNARIALSNMLVGQIAMCKRRFVLMAMEAMRTGKVTVSGEGYETVVVDFGRKAGHTITLAGGNRWGQAGVKPLDSLTDWQQTALQDSGAMLTDVIMAVDVWKVFRADADVKDRLATQRRLGEMPTLDQATPKVAGLNFMGTLDGFNIFTYSDWYRDDNDAEQPVLPSGQVVMTGAELEGVQAFGGILDGKAGYRAMDFFSKSWEEDDPAVRFVMTQSAPLMVPRRVDASMNAAVL